MEFDSAAGVARELASTGVDDAFETTATLRARSHCRFLPPLIHYIPDSLR
jgi:hypothetical protein